LNLQYLLALLAIAKEFDLMVYNLKAAFFYDILFQRLQQIIGKFHDLAALHADQMMMLMGIRLGVIHLIPAAAITEFHLLQNAQLAQKLQAAVYGGQTYIGMIISQKAMDILSTQMLARMGKKYLQNHLALRRHLMLPLLQLCLQVFHRKCTLHYQNLFSCLAGQFRPAEAKGPAAGKNEISFLF